MFFLLKSFACIALVLFALGWRGVDSPQNPAERQMRATPAEPPQRPHIEESARSLAKAGADALVSAARDKCFAAPRECAALLERYQGGGHAR